MLRAPGRSRRAGRVRGARLLWPPQAGGLIPVLVTRCSAPLPGCPSLRYPLFPRPSSRACGCLSPVLLSEHLRSPFSPHLHSLPSSTPPLCCLGKSHFCYFSFFPLYFPPSYHIFMPCLLFPDIFPWLLSCPPSSPGLSLMLLPSPLLPGPPASLVSHLPSVQLPALPGRDSAAVL